MSSLARNQSQSQKEGASSIARSNPATAGTNHLAHPLFRLQQTVGNQAVRRVFQAKRTVGRPGDAYEREADHVAERVVRMPEPRLQPACACGGECAGCRNKPASHTRVQTARLGTNPLEKTTAPPIVDEALHSSGRPLDGDTRAFFEPRFGRDFGAVRIHADARASEAARSVNAGAFTVGSDIVFGRGEYSPDTAEGRTLLAHELTHTAQQGAEDTLAHESGHAAGYTGDAEGGHHSNDPQNLMSPGSIRLAGATPDANWCQQMAATAR